METKKTGSQPTLRYHIKENKHSTGRWGKTPLHIACQKNNLDIVKKLVEIQKEDPNSKDDHGNSLVHVAAMNGCLDVLKYLIDEQKCSSVIQGEYGRTPFHAACQKSDNLPVVKYLVEEKHMNPNEKDDNGNTPLHMAVMCGCLDILKYLIEQCGCNPKCPGAYGGSLLHHACNVYIVKYLVENQELDPYERDEGGDTSINVAAYNRRLEILQYLIEGQKYNLSCLGMWNRTPLHDACQQEHNLPVVRYLVEQGGDIFSKDDYGLLPVDIATMFANHSVCEFLKQKMELTTEPVASILPPGSGYAFKYGSKTQYDYVDRNQNPIEIHHPSIKENLGPMLMDWNVFQTAKGEIKFLNTKATLSIDEDPRSVAQRYELALREGYVRASFLKVLVIGSAGVGKTHLLHLLFDRPPPVIRDSTAMLVRPMQAIQTICKPNNSFEEISDRELHQLLAAEINKISSPTLSSCDQQSKNLSVISSVPDQSSKGKGEHPVLSPVFNSKSFHESDFVDKMIPCIATCKDVPLLDINWVYFVDSGGQPQFHQLLSFFMYNTDLNIFVFRLCDRLCDNPTITFYENGSPLHSSTSVLSNIEIVQSCVQATQTLDEDGQSKLLIVGTHRDKENECERETKDDKNDMLKRLIPSSMKKKLVYSSICNGNVSLIFSLNAKNPSDEDKNTVAKIAREVWRLRDSATKSKNIPIRWLAFHQELQAISKDLKSDLLSYSICLQTAERLHMFKEDVIAALQFFSDLNVILYYHSILPEVVFISPQALFDIVTEIIKLVSYDKFNEAIDYDHVIAYKKGIISIKYVEALKPRLPSIFKDGLFEPKDMITLFQHLHIVSKFKTSDEYFMPSLLKGLKREEIEDLLLEGLKREKIQDKHKYSLQLITHGAYYYEDRSFSCGEFASLITTLLSLDNWALAFEGDELNLMCVHSNCIKLFYGIHIVTLVDSVSYIEIHVTSSDKVLCQERGVCAEIRQNILKMLKSTATWAFFCPCTLYQKHLAKKVKNYEVWSCSQNPSRTFKLSKGHLPEVLHDCTAIEMECDLHEPQHKRKCMEHTSLSTIQTSCILEETDLDEVMTEVMDIASSWKSLGIALKLIPSNLDIIQHKNHYDPVECLRDVLHDWLLRRNVNKKSDLPSWESLSKAVQSRSGGNNPALASKILKKLMTL